MSAESLRSTQLAEELTRRTGRPIEFDEPPTLLGSGFSTEILAFAVTDPIEGHAGPMVLRVLHDGGEREQIVHRMVADAGFATPRPLLWGDGESCFGQPYVVMPRLDGVPAVQLRGVEALRAFRRAPVLVADTMGSLHDLDARPVIDALHDGGFDDAQLGVEAQLAEIEDAADGSEPVGEAADVLRTTRPRSDRTVVVHGDLHALNLWRERDGTIVLLDWELATVGPPELDLARSDLIFSLVPGEIGRAARPLVMRLGRRSARAFRERYSRRHPVDEGSLPWYRSLHALRLCAAVLTRPPGDAVAAQWRPVGAELAAVVEATTGVRLRLTSATR